MSNLLGTLSGTMLKEGGAEGASPSSNVEDILQDVEITPVIQTGMYNGERVRIGSRKIRIEQIKKFSMLPSDPKAKQIRDEVIKNVASQWKAGTRDIIRGCTPVEEQIYLPRIIGLKPEHPDWETKVKDFWANFKFSVPVDGGIEFEAGFKYKEGSTTVAEPININDFLSYNFARVNSNVASEGEDNPITFTFKLIDTAAKDIENEVVFSLRLVVDRMFLKLCNDAENIPSEASKIDWILETKGGPMGLGMSIHGLTKVQKQMELQKIKERDLIGFKELLLDRDLEAKAIIRKAVTFRKIEQVGNTYIYNGITIGHTEKAATIWLKDPANSQHTVILMESLREYTR